MLLKARKYKLRNNKKTFEGVEAPADLKEFLDHSTQEGYQSYVYPIDKHGVHYVLRYFPNTLKAYHFITNIEADADVYWFVVSVAKESEIPFFSWIKNSLFSCFDLSQS